jgi:hypothetical protein
VLLWQMAYGNRPWAGMSHAAIVHAVCVERRQLEFGGGGGAPNAMQLIAQACMAHNAGERPTFADVLDLLSALGDPADPDACGAASASGAAQSADGAGPNRVSRGMDAALASGA